MASVRISVRKSKPSKKTVLVKPCDEKNGAESEMRDQSLRQTLSAILDRLGFRVRAEVNDGFVKLEGHVSTYRQKERLHRFVMQIAGVRALKDLVQVQPAETVGDRQIALHIRHALDAHSELPPGTAVVDVRGGSVRLKGHVRSAEERFVAENVACHCRGVSVVVNDLKVDPLEERSDEATVRAVRSALAYCEEFETDAITISCCDGRVSLRGEVPTLLDRALAEEVARLQAGVCRVDNHIQVSEAQRTEVT